MEKAVRDKLTETALDLVEAYTKGEKPRIREQLGSASPHAAAWLAVAVEHGLISRGEAALATKWVVDIERWALEALEPRGNYKPIEAKTLKIEEQQ